MPRITSKPYLRPRAKQPLRNQALRSGNNLPHVKGRGVRKQTLAQKPLMYPKNCTFAQARQLSKQLKEWERVYVETSDYPGAGRGTKASRPFVKNEVVLELKGKTAHSFVDPKSRKTVTMKIVGHKAETLPDDRHVLFLQGVTSDITVPKTGKTLSVSHGVEPFNYARYLNSSNGQPANLKMVPVISPAVIADKTEDTMTLKSGAFTENDVHVLGVATSPIDKDEELLFPYSFPTGCSYLHKKPTQCKYAISSALEHFDPKGSRYREQHGWLHNDTHRVTLKDLKTQPDINLLPKGLHDLLTALIAQPSKLALQNRLQDYKDNEISAQALISSCLYGSTTALTRRRIYNIRDRLNRMGFPNFINPGTEWSYADAFRYGVQNQLIAPVHEMTLVPFSFIAEEVKVGNVTILVRLIRSQFNEGVDPSSVAGNMKRCGVPVLARGYPEWDAPALQAFCAHVGIEIPLSAKEGKANNKHQEALWNQCRAGNIHTIWQVLTRFKQEEVPLSQIVKRLNLHRTAVNGKPLRPKEKYTLGHLVDFIQTQGDSKQKKEWLNYIHREILTNSQICSFGQMLVRGIRATKNKWLLLAAVEARLISRSCNPSTVVRNLRKQKLPMLPFKEDDSEKDTERLYTFLKEEERGDLAAKFKQNAGPKLTRRLNALDS